MTTQVPQVNPKYPPKNTTIVTTPMVHAQPSTTHNPGKWHYVHRGGKLHAHFGLISGSLALSGKQ